MSLLTPSDSLRAVLDSVFAAPEYHWVDQRGPLLWLERYWLLLQDWLSHFREANPSLFFWVVWGLVAVLVLIFVHGGYVVWRTLEAAGAGGARDASLPPAEIRDAAWYSRDAERLARAGRFVEALQSAFLALLLDLDRRQLVRYHPSKTPREYTREAALAPAERERLGDLVTSLYGYSFAGLPCGPDQFQNWRELAAGVWHAPAH